jgi:hypothetical protein
MKYSSSIPPGPPIREPAIPQPNLPPGYPGNPYEPPEAPNPPGVPPDTGEPEDPNRWTVAPNDSREKRTSGNSVLHTRLTTIGLNGAGRSPRSPGPPRRSLQRSLRTIGRQLGSPVAPQHKRSRLLHF